MTTTTAPHLSDFPAFKATVEAHLPGTVSLEEYFLRSCETLSRYGFVDANTLGVVGTCRDEIASPLETEIVRHWGRTFGCRSLGGFLLLGRTGVKTGISHAPLEDGRRRFVFYAMPHVAISEAGQIGEVYREGIHEASHACGSLQAVVSQLQSGRIDVHMDFDDLEQSCVRQKLLSNLHYGDRPDLMGMTKLSSRIILQDLQRLLCNLAKPSEFDYAFVSGILVHGPHDTHWVFPEHCEVVSAALPGGRAVLPAL
jgi:hypothetical protein